MNLLQEISLSTPAQQCSDGYNNNHPNSFPGQSYHGLVWD